MVGVSNRELVDSFETFFRKYMHEDILEFAQRYPSEQLSLTVDWRNDLTVFDPDLADDFREQPEQIRPCANAALQEYDVPAHDLSNATVRLENVGYENEVRYVGEYGVREIGNLIPVRGQVNQVTEKRPGLERGAFECLLCGTLTYNENPTEDQMEPHECQGCDRDGPFRLVESKSEFKNTQLMRLQLPPEKSNGTTSEHVDVNLEGDLVNKATPGDRIEVAAHLGVELEDENEFTAEAHDVKLQETDFEDIDTDEYEDEIKELAANDPYDKIVSSVAPALYGYDTIKLAIALQMFGGTQKKLPDGSTERGDSHIFLIGDPGVGKSVMLKFADMLSPRSIYTDGKGSTSAGLTASAVRDDFGGNQWTIKGGSLVKAHKGMACVDELDDMEAEDRAALNTALESQEIPVSKAGITATLPAKTTLLAAANPKHGRFDPYEPIAEQIDIDPTLISRFDLIFVMKDNHSESVDEDIIHHKAVTSKVGQLMAAGEDVPEPERKKAEPEIDDDVMRAYIAYAKQEVTPVLTDDAADLLESEFKNLRQLNQSANEDPEREGRAVPVTYRKQEALTRLAEASARVRLSGDITTDDVERALSLVTKSLEDVGMDPNTGEYDADIVETGQPKSQRNRVQYVTRMIDELDDESPQGCPYDKLIEVAAGGKYDQSEIDRTIDKLKDQGKVYEPSSEHLRTT